MRTERPQLSKDDFEEFFVALWGNDPFAWQKKLAARVMSNPSVSDSRIGQGDEGRDSPWPEVIALPTAWGKTACMDIAVFALAAEAEGLGSGRAVVAPRRIFFVVDRRIIVDEAYERARRLADRLTRAEEGILKSVADNLRCISRGETTGFEGELPLAVHSLRGGMYRSEAWARNPLQPMVVASTVDQIGSRLLFRAYGRGSGTWPIYAGLVANDSLVLLDEAHCSQPFLQTLNAARKYRSWALDPLDRCFHPVVMSATPPPGTQEQNVFRDWSDERNDPKHPLGKRNLARKPVALRRPIPSARGKSDTGKLSEALATAARGLLSDARRAVVVFVNRVATARETSRLLRCDPRIDVVLLTGRMRPLDKDAVVERLKRLHLHSDQSTNRTLPRPVIVVATQTLEVGADLDFDGLVTECAALDALRQRFGRLNRMGRRVDARAEILIRADQAKPKRGEEHDPVYGEALNKTWEWLNELEDLDFGIDRMVRALAEVDASDFASPSARAPVMLPAHVDCWSQTAPEPRPSPDVAPFLHGPQEGAPDVHVCWRADLDLSSEETRRHAIESLALCPPSSVETLPVPISRFRRWLAGENSEDLSADVEHVIVETGSVPAEQAVDLSAARKVVRWRGAQTHARDITWDAADIRPGDVVVIPTTHPGAPSQLGDLPLAGTETPDVLDIGDQAHRMARAKPILRLHEALVRVWPDSVSAKSAALSLLEDLKLQHEEEPEEIAAGMRDLLAELATADVPAGWDWLRHAAEELRAEFASTGRLLREYRMVGGRNLVLAGRRRIKRLAQEADVFSDEDDASASGTSHANGQPVLLRTHLPGVEEFARRHAVGCGLSDDLVEAIARAGLLHDLGKADPRFQSLLRGGSPWMAGEPWAKSARMPKTPAGRRRAREIAQYPEGGRHELLSVRLAESAPALLPEDEELRELVLHLVASHHGHCRPFAPVVFDAEAPCAEHELCGQRMRWSGPTGLERLDSGVADRYWRLTRRYGWWGLAWLEALLRLADWRRSEWEETHDADE